VKVLVPVLLSFLALFPFLISLQPFPNTFFSISDFQTQRELPSQSSGATWLVRSTSGESLVFKVDPSVTELSPFHLSHVISLFSVRFYFLSPIPGLVFSSLFTTVYQLYADFLRWIGIYSQLSHPCLVPFCGYWAGESCSEHERGYKELGFASPFLSSGSRQDLLQARDSQTDSESHFKPSRLRFDSQDFHRLSCTHINYLTWDNTMGDAFKSSMDLDIFPYLPPEA
jgi:hypothetical protein